MLFHYYPILGISRFQPCNVRGLEHKQSDVILRIISMLTRGFQAQLARYHTHSTNVRGSSTAILSITLSTNVRGSTTASPISHSPLTCVVLAQLTRYQTHSTNVCGSSTVSPISHTLH